MNRHPILMDPTHEAEAGRLPLAARPPDLRGRTVGLLDISKPQGDRFLDHLEALLQAQAVMVARFRKPTFTRPMPADLRREIAERCDLVIEALAD